MIPCYSSTRSKENFVPNEEYFNSTSTTTVKKMPPPPMTNTTDHSHRIGKLLPYISSMVSPIAYSAAVFFY
jgi:hypothetical protein